MAGVLFVPLPSSDQSVDDVRRTIRRHVMLGKNRGRTQKPKQPTLDGAAVFHKDDWFPHKQVQRRTQSAVPRKVGSDLSFLSFADTVKRSLLSDTLHFCLAMNAKLFVLEPCISFSPTDGTGPCVQMLAHDALYLNVMVFGTQAYMDNVARQTASQLRASRCAASIQHYVKALHLLRERVADAERHRFQISDITLMAIVPLAALALITGEFETARNHIVGLGRLLKMREDEGFAFKSEMKHRIEILRCDISVSLATGQPPVFPEYLDQMPLPEFEDPGKTPQACIAVKHGELAEIFDMLRRFCATINKAVTDRATLQEIVVLGTLASAMYRLLDVITLPASADEAVRLAMLAFCASAFVHWPQIRIPSPWLKHEYKRCIFRSTRCLDPAMVLWLLTTYEITFYPLDADEHEEVRLIMMKAIDLCGITHWDGVKATLSEFLWIDIIYDPAQRILEEGLTGSHRALY